MGEIVSRRPDVFERDVDAILQARISLDANFRKKILDAISVQARIPLAYDTVSVERQARHAGVPGTIDILIQLRLSGGCDVGRVLLENKLDSSFTPSQPERYAASAAAMSCSGRPAIPAICAPGEYLRKSRYLAPFRARLSYEDMEGWLDGDDLKIVRQAILRFSMPYEPDPEPAVAEFHEGYKKLSAQLAPELVVKPNPNVTGARPEKSRTIYFLTAKCLPRWDFLPTLRFSHQCWDSGAPRPSVKITFTDWARHEPLLRRVGASALGNTGIYLRKAGRSLGLTHDTPRMDNKRSVDSQIYAVSAGIRAAATLRAWMFSNELVLHDWAEAVYSIKSAESG